MSTPPSALPRRSFLRRTLGVTAAAAAAPLVGGEPYASSGFGRSHVASGFSRPNPAPSAAAARFRLNYAPSFGQFTAHAGKELLGQIEFVSAEGFTAMFDNGLMNRPVADQELIARELAKRDMKLGPFVLESEFKQRTLVMPGKEAREAILQKMRAGVETMKRTGCRQALVVPGRFDESLAWDYQTANVVDHLRACMEICEPAGLVVVLEPLNPKNHPGLFLSKIPQAYQICRAVNSPSCKINNDLYHQQITEGNLIPNIDAAWEEIASFHLGDNPGRKEPTTGEINYRNVFRHIHDKGYQGVLCMEHGQSKPGREGERAVIEAYRACDSF